MWNEIWFASGPKVDNFEVNFKLKATHSILIMLTLIQILHIHVAWDISFLNITIRQKFDTWLWFQFDIKMGHTIWEPIMRAIQHCNDPHKSRIHFSESKFAKLELQFGTKHKHMMACLYDPKFNFAMGHTIWKLIFLNI